MNYAQVFRLRTKLWQISSHLKESTALSSLVPTSINAVMAFGFRTVFPFRIQYERRTGSLNFKLHAYFLLPSRNSLLRTQFQRVLTFLYLWT